MMLMVFRAAERRNWGSAIYFAVGGTLAAVATVAMIGLAIALAVLLTGRPNPTNALIRVTPIMWLAIGGPIAGYAYWRLARKELLAAQATA
ncbi:MAG: hypothetical protein ACKVP7_00220 [Hyphomicrobiaceae bacterium]